MKTKVYFSLLIGCLFLVQSAFSAEVIGRVVKARGVIQKTNQSMGVSQVVKEGDELYEGDQLKSGRGSFAKLLMKDDTLFQLGPKSEFSLEKFSFRTKKDRDAVYNLAKGKLRSLFTVKSEKKSLTIRTPTSAMGIRGTEILSDVYSKGGKIYTDIALISGKLDVDVKGLGNKGESFKLKPGFVLETGGALKANIKAPKPKMRALPKKIFKKLRKGDKKGGQIFLFDARKSAGDIAHKKVSFGGLNKKKEKELSKKFKVEIPEISAVDSGKMMDVQRPKLDKPKVGVKGKVKMKRRRRMADNGLSPQQIAAMAAKRAAYEAAKQAAQEAAQEAAEEQNTTTTSGEGGEDPNSGGGSAGGD